MHALLERTGHIPCGAAGPQASNDFVEAGWIDVERFVGRVDAGRLKSGVLKARGKRM
jgi:hypothetical protein